VYGDSEIYFLDSLWERTRGVIGRDTLLDMGVVILPSCNWVHTFFVRRSLQLFFLNREFEIVRHVGEMRPFRFSPYVYEAFYTLECSLSLPIDHVRALLYHLRTSHVYDKL
jgi:hypothetical protein